MKKKSSTYIPASYAGILRYREEFEKDKIVLKPYQVVLITILISVALALPWIFLKFL